MNNSSINVQQCLEQIKHSLDKHELFFGHGTDNAWDEACWLLETVLKRDGINEISEDTPLIKSQLEVINAILSRRIKEKKPLAYLLEEAWFANYPFYVDERVLIPRSPIAELIRNQYQPLLQSAPKRIVDLCCGSGCIGIATALAFPEASMVLADLSVEALEVAKVNVAKYQLKDRSKIVQSDLYDKLEGHFDLIISNPPYVSREEYEGLPEEYLQEPEIGLVSMDNGLAIPAQIIREATTYLNENGVLILEVGYSWQALAKAFPQYPFLWLDFEYGGEGVCMLTREQIVEGNARSSKTFGAK